MMAIDEYRIEAIRQMAQEDAMKQHLAELGASQRMHSPDFLLETAPPAGAASRVIKQMALPTIGGAVGTLAGAAAAGATGGGAAPLIAVGNAMGQGAGEAGNQLLGIGENSGGLFDLPSPPMDKGKIAMSMAVPLGFSALGQVKHLGHQLGADQGARHLNEIAVDEFNIATGKIGDWASIKNQSKDLFGKVELAGGSIRMKHTLDAIDNFLPTLTHGSKGAIDEFKKQADKLRFLKDMIVQGSGSISPVNLHRELGHFDSAYASIENAGGKGPGRNALARIRESLVEDLDAAATAARNAINKGIFTHSPANINASVQAQLAGGQSADMLIQARDLWKRGTLLQDMGEEAAKSLKVSAGQGLDATFNAKRLINWLKTDRFFKQALDSEEQQGIMGTLETLNSISRMQSAAGSGAGVSRLLRELRLGGGLGSLAGAVVALAGANPAAITLASVAGGLAGGAMIPAKELGHNIALALQMHTGRQLLVDLALNTVSRYTPAVANLLGAFTSTMLNGQGRNGNTTPQEPGLADTMMQNLLVPAGKEFNQ